MKRAKNELVTIETTETEINLLLKALADLDALPKEYFEDMKSYEILIQLNRDLFDILIIR